MAIVCQYKNIVPKYVWCPIYFVTYGSCEHDRKKQTNIAHFTAYYNYITYFIIVIIKIREMSHSKRQLIKIIKYDMKKIPITIRYSVTVEYKLGTYYSW